MRALYKFLYIITKKKARRKNEWLLNINFRFGSYNMNLNSRQLEYDYFIIKYSNYDPVISWLILKHLSFSKINFMLLSTMSSILV